MKVNVPLDFTEKSANINATVRTIHPVTQYQETAFVNEVGWEVIAANLA